ncbi:MAG: glycosyl transferase, WecB/TagA/CpsF family [Microbacteriaceae bacterium]|nr:glycosyl transferase, WecB/TagA/CpsF family [Microbacteriaceae bacterium]
MTAVETYAQPVERVNIGGCPLDLRLHDEAIDAIRQRATSVDGNPLAVVSVNLDHVHHFGAGSRWYGTIGELPTTVEDGIEWLNLIDGAPLATQAERMTGTHWPRLAGSDLIEDILANAELDGLSVGIMGGNEETHAALRATVGRGHPRLRIAGLWAPSRDELSEHEVAHAQALAIAEADTDILVVCLGKPRQELWIAEHGEATGARVLLAFGAVVDFLANRIERAPRLVVDAKMEWAWRLAREPRRLATRYLVDGPPAYQAVRRGGPMGARRPLVRTTPPISVPIAGELGGRFSSAKQQASIAVVIVTFNSARHLPELIASLRAETADLNLRVIVADNGSTDETRDILAANPDIISIDASGNRGYAGGINIAVSRTHAADAILILNPDLVVRRGALVTMLGRLATSGAGAVVPKILDPEGATYPSLRHEPTILRAVGDALLGSHYPQRPTWSTEQDVDVEGYQHAHLAEWATGAAILIHQEAARAVGAWDPQFFLYSEETDFFRRLRGHGYTVWYEPSASVQHDQGGSGASTELAALMAVNRVRYVRKHHPRRYARVFHAAVVLHEIMRAYDPAHRAALRILLDRSTWERLPQATEWPEIPADLGGTIIIPAHDEEAVIGRTLRLIAPLATENGVEIIVACNGCTDATASVAREFAGVRVIEIATPSKAAALNAGDDAATNWPRLYLDADIETHPGAVAAVFHTLTSGDALAARPAFRYNTAHASSLVRAYYRARDRMPSTRKSLWGAGAYALSEEGHERFGRFLALTADDLLIDAAFGRGEKSVVATEPVRVNTPRVTAGLLAILTRQRRGNTQAGGTSTTWSTARELAGSIRGPLTLADALAYVGLTAWSRVAAALASPTTAWERDDSSRKI